MYVLYDDQRQDEEAYGYRKTDPEHDRRRKESRFAIESISAAFFIDKKFLSSLKYSNIIVHTWIIVHKLRHRLQLLIVLYRSR